jgi:predicted metal-dependent hydrolase
MNIVGVIVVFVADLNAFLRIESVAESLGYLVQQIESAEVLGPPDESSIGKQFAEPLVGRDSLLVDRISRIRPVLMIFDLSNRAIPWENWITVLTSVPATRRIPVLCYGSHVDRESLEKAKNAGARQVVPRSKFFRELPDLIELVARHEDPEQLESACLEMLSPEARKGLEEFNRGEYFQAHESLELAWMSDRTAARELYRAVLQVAVAYYQILRGNYNGALKMFLRNRQWIEPLPDQCRGIDVGRLRADAKIVYEALVKLGPENIKDFDRALLQPVQYRD